MVYFACTGCRCRLQAPEAEIGRMIPCPYCRGQVQVPVPASSESSSSTMWLILAIVGACVLGLMCLIIVPLAAMLIIGHSANTTFNNVGAAIGS